MRLRHFYINESIRGIGSSLTMIVHNNGTVLNVIETTQPKAFRAPWDDFKVDLIELIGMTENEAIQALEEAITYSDDELNVTLAEGDDYLFEMAAYNQDLLKELEDSLSAVSGSDWENDGLVEDKSVTETVNL